MTLQRQAPVVNNYGCNGSAGDGAVESTTWLALFLAKVGVQDAQFAIEGL